MIYINSVLLSKIFPLHWLSPDFSNYTVWRGSYFVNLVSFLFLFLLFVFSFFFGQISSFKSSINFHWILFWMEKKKRKPYRKPHRWKEETKTKIKVAHLNGRRYKSTVDVYATIWMCFPFSLSLDLIHFWVPITPTPYLIKETNIKKCQLNLKTL